MSWPACFTYNFCSNPSFEVDLTGVSAINGGTFSLDPYTGLFGNQSLSVVTLGKQSSEGVILPPGTVLASAAGCASFYLVGSSTTASGTLTATAIDTTTSTVLGSTAVEFDPTLSWQRVVIPDLNLVNGDSIAVYVQTVGVQQTQFHIDAIQYEPNLPLNGDALPTAYIDGDQLFGFWVGTQQESASYKLWQFQMGANGGIRFYGDGSLLNQGATFPLVFTDPASGPAVAQGNIDFSGKTFTGLTGVLAGGGTVVQTGISVLLMYAGLNDFATFLNTDIDPAISLVGYNNAGISTGTNTSGNAGYTRPYATFSAPVAFASSAGTNVWNTAAYFAVGYEFGSLATTVAQDITHVQAEVVPGNGQPVVPSAYKRPRALTATIVPTRLNYIPNPSFEVLAGNTSLGIADGTFETGVSGWSASGATLTQSGAQHHSGSFSALMTNTVSGAGTQSYLRPTVVPVVGGYSYTATVWVFTATASQSFNAAIDWYDVNHTYISTSSGTASNATVSTWTTYTETANAPSNAAYAQYGPTNNAPSASTVYYVDDVTFVINNVSPVWIADSVNTTSLSQIAGGAVTGSNYSMKVVTAAANAGAYCIVPFLIVGETYTASAYVNNTSNSTANTAKISIGGASATLSAPQNTWERISVSFTATQSNNILDLQMATAGTFEVDAVLLEVGQVVEPYADGSFTGWDWENALTPGTTRSYYYVRGNIAYAAVQEVLADHLPLGLTAYAPVYNSPPTQYS